MLVGVVGGGWYGRMLALAGYPLGVDFRFLEPTPRAPVAQIAELIEGGYAEEPRLEELARGAGVVILETEDVPANAARFLAERVPVHPSPDALERLQDRLEQKNLLQGMGVSVASFEPVASAMEAHAALDRIGFPATLRARRLGWEGAGQAVIKTRDPEDVRLAWSGMQGAKALLEGLVKPDRELSMIAVRGSDGDTAFYPCVENHHVAGILRRTLAPAPGLTAELQGAAEGIATRVFGELGYVGVLTVELLQKGEELVVDQLVPRAHDSGNWTIEGAETSQFENHVRAVTGLPLGSTSAVGTSASLHAVGMLPDVASVLAVPGAHLHLYSKEPRPRRRLGHITVRADDEATLAARVDRLAPLLEL